MHLYEAERLCRALMREWLDSTWYFEWSNTKTAHGDCTYKRHRIRLSKPLTLANTREVVENTIRHEIAHALAGPKAGHGPEWKVWCRKVGAKPVRCADQTGMDTQTVTGRYQATCGTCQTTSYRHRWSKNMAGSIACGPCCRQYNGGRFDKRFVLVFRQSW